VNVLWWEDPAQLCTSSELVQDHIQWQTGISCIELSSSVTITLAIVISIMIYSLEWQW
jgi:hypothetical protein